MKQGYKYSWSEMELLSENWRKFAKNHSGKSKTIGAHSFGNWSDPILRKFELRIPFLKGEIVFATSEFKPLKMTYKFSKRTNIEFLIYPEDFTDKIAKFLGAKEIEIGHEKFDESYFIKGSNEEFMHKLLDSQLREFLLENYISNFKLTQANKIDVIELNIVINELELDEMTKVLNLFKNCIMIIEGEITSPNKS